MASGIYKRKSISDRFQESYIVNAETGCWEWQKDMVWNGYGRIFCYPKNIYAHRFSYQLFIGKLNNSKELVCHKCDNRKCVNPFHLFKGTYRENDQDSRNKGRQPTARHGSIFMYKKGCRCDECHKVQLAYAKDFRSRHKDKIKQYNERYKLKKLITLNNSK